MRVHHPFLIIVLVSLSLAAVQAVQHSTSGAINQRRILHQPLFPVSSGPPPATDLSTSPPSPPAPDSQAFPTPDKPFFPEVPTRPAPDEDQQQPVPASPANGTISYPAATQPAKPAKRVAIAISVGIVTLGMLSALAFFLYRHRAKHPRESQKLINGGDSRRFGDDQSSGIPPSSFLYIGTVEPSRTSVIEANGTANMAANASPYHKLNSIKRSDRYRPSPELQPLALLPRPPSQHHHESDNSPSRPSTVSEEESQGTAFYTPHASSVSNDDSYYTPISMKPASATVKNGIHVFSTSSVPHSKRNSPVSRFVSVSSPEMKHVIIPSIRQSPLAPQPPPSPPSPPPPQPESRVQHAEPKGAYVFKRTKFSSPPPPPNIALLRSINNEQSNNIPAAPPPPPPPPPPPKLPGAAALAPRKMGSLETAKTTVVSSVPKQESWQPSRRTNSPTETTKSEKKAEIRGSSTERTDAEENNGAKPKLKPLHWDKVRASSDRATVWDQIKSSSFQLNEDMIENLFGFSSTNSIPKETTRKCVLPPVERENRVLDPKKSQNIAIMLRALNVTIDEVSEALLDGNPESLGVELLETLVKMAPTKEEEIKLREYSGDIPKLGSAERFLKAILDIPFAYRRVEAMLYRANFDAEVKYLRKSFQTLEVASEELKNSRLFLKLLEAVLRTGNRMNVGTNRGDAKAFKLDTLLKLVDIKGTDGKTTLLHFVVQEIIRSEDPCTGSTNENLQDGKHSKMKEDDFRKQGLLVVSGLSRDLANVKKAAGMDSDVLSSYVLKLEMELEKVRSVLRYEKPDVQGIFFNSMKQFLGEAEEEIKKIKADERKALLLLKDVTEYFHGNTAKEEAHPFRIFIIVRDFLNILDNVCKEVRKMQDRTMVGSARSFRICAIASLPVLNRYNASQDRSSDDDSSSP